MINFNINNKSILIILVMCVAMFILYHFQFSSYAQCVDGYVKSREYMYKKMSKSSQKYYNNLDRNNGKVHCKANTK